MGGSLILGVLKNNWQLAAFLVSVVVGAGFWQGEHEILVHTRTELAAREAVLRDVKAQADRQDYAAAMISKQQKDRSDVIQAQLTSALEAHRLTGDALTASVLRYENGRGAGQVCAGPGAAAGFPRHDSHAKSGGGDQRIAVAIATVPSACQTVIDQLGACQAWAKDGAVPSAGDVNWFGKRPPPPAIPPHVPVQVRTEHAPKEEPGIEVEEVDTQDMSSTGIFRAWKKMTGRGD